MVEPGNLNGWTRRHLTRFARESDRDGEKDAQPQDLESPSHRHQRLYDGLPPVNALHAPRFRILLEDGGEPDQGSSRRSRSNLEPGRAPADSGDRNGPYSTQSTTNRFVSPGFLPPRFEAKTSFLPSGENIGKPSKPR
jgi:hypothetical protein